MQKFCSLAWFIFHVFESEDFDFFNCLDVDECLQSSCSTNALCQDTIGSFLCNCSAGFFGDGHFCEGIYYIDLTAKTWKCATIFVWWHFLLQAANWHFHGVYALMMKTVDWLLNNICWHLWFWLYGRKF
jgi:hypothetical protein